MRLIYIAAPLVFLVLVCWSMTGSTGEKKAEWKYKLDPPFGQQKPQAFVDDDGDIWIAWDAYSIRRIRLIERNSNTRILGWDLSPGSITMYTEGLGGARIDDADDMLEVSRRLKQWKKIYIEETTE